VFEQCFGISVSPLERQIIGKPERARKKRAFARRQVVDPLLCRIADDETIER